MNNREVCKLTDLKDVYIEFLSDTAFANPNYRSSSLENKLYNDDTIKNTIGFELIKIARIAEFYIVFSTVVGLGEAIGKGYILAHRHA